MTKRTAIKVFICALLLSLVAIEAHTLDYPHTGTNSISCDDCHYVWGSEPSLLLDSLTFGGDIDDTQYNALCWSCHDNVTATQVYTHSSLQTDNGYGDWTVECRTCHDPHGNYQFRTYGSDSYIYQGTVTSVDATTLTQTGAGWTNDQFKDLIVIPNTAWNYNNYRITGNDSDTLTVAGPIDLAYANPGDTFAIVYGRLIKSTLATPNSGSKAVKFFNTTGANSFADGDATYDGVCEACHTQTTYHRNDATGNHTHNVGLDCANCHDHTKGFDIACDVCHGNPPVDGGTLVFDPGTTGSATAGAHNLHVTTEGYACTECHYNSAGSGATHNNGLTVTMGFYNFGGAQQGGSYDGQGGVTYNATTTSPVTSVSNTGNKQCSGVYCHSTGQSTSDPNSSTPTYATPTWDNPATGACGTCHAVAEGSGLTSGSHGEHLGTTGVNGCGDCHTGAANDASSYSSTNHFNNSINVANSYTLGGAPGNGYGTCSAASCHHDGVSTQKTSPAWGSPGGGCAECHAEVPSTGSHSKHVTTTLYKAALCGDCHDGAVRNTTAPAQHLDGDLDVYDSSAGDLGYPQDEAMGGSPYGSCSTAYCHSTGQSTSDGNSSTPTYATVTWADTAACGTCHKVTEASGLTSGSHAAHLGSSGVNGCGDCHTGAADNASAYNSTEHVDKTIDVANSYTAGGAPGNGYGTCTTICHGSTSPTWGTDLSLVATCAKCHGNQGTGDSYPPDDTNGDSADTDDQVGAHVAHMTLPSGYTDELNSGGNCNECHKVPSVVGDTGHIDATPQAEVFPGTINPEKADLNSVTPDYTAGTCTVYCHGSSMPKGSSQGSDTTPSWNNANLLTGTRSLVGDCSVCHGAPPTTVTPHSGSESLSQCKDCHDHFNIDGSLNNAALHINGSVEASAACNSCHAYPPTPGDGKAYMKVSGSPPVAEEGKGAHVAHVNHIQALYIAGGGSALDPNNDTFGDAKTTAICGVCHDMNAGNHDTDGNGTRLINFNNSTAYQFGPSAPNYNGVIGTAGSTTAKTCSSVSCHFKITPEWEAY
jgi:predicted CxxxxCH...CXXCH cytochrome family protein